MRRHHAGGARERLSHRHRRRWDLAQIQAAVAEADIGNVEVEKDGKREKVKLPKRKIGRYKAAEHPFRYVPERF